MGNSYKTEFKEKYLKNAGVKLTKTQVKIMSLVNSNNIISQSEIAKKLKVSESTVYSKIERLKMLGVLCEKELIKLVDG